MTEVYQFLYRGGVLMIPIGLVSIIALTIFLERIWALQATRIVPTELLDKVLALVREKKLKGAREECLRSNTPLGRILLSGIDARKLSRSEQKVVLEEAGKRQISQMERFIEALGTCASIEPLLGLLGTVYGMIQVFQQVVTNARSGAVDPGLLANGIWQALITTAAGLTIGIPAFVGYRYLLSRSNHFILDLEDGALRLVEALHPLDTDEERSE